MVESAGHADRRMQMERTMSKYSTVAVEQDTRLLRHNELDAVAGGTPGYPGLPLGTNLNVSIWSDRPFDFQWVLVGATGTLPR
jgi:hypothetical protein